MAKKVRSELKSYFESGKRPNQSEFEDLNSRVSANLKGINYTKRS